MMMASQKQDRGGTMGIDLGMTLAALGLALLMIVLATQVHAQTLTVLHSFTGGKDGANPAAGLTMDARGNLYGTASAGGAGHGTVYKLSHAGSGWTLSPLYVFGGSPDGSDPVARVVFGPNGTLYGTTEHGGNINCGGGCGTIFNLQPQPTACTAALCPWMETELLRFNGVGGGIFPESEVTFDAAGNLYGTAYSGGGLELGGGSGCYPYSCGLVYELTPSGSGWTESVPYVFTGYQYGDNGANPVGGLTFDSAGNLYGTTSTYGDCGFGIIFQLTSNGSGWTENILQQICSGGASPTATMITDASGTFYGDTQGEYPGYGTQHGSVFTLAQSGSSWVYTSVYTFPEYGGGPAGQLFRDGAGNLYGTTITGGGNPLGLCSSGCGTIFKLTPSGSGYSYTQLYSFTGGSDGSAPYSNLVQDTDGNFYGTASTGGADGYGVIFEFTP